LTAQPDPEKEFFVIVRPNVSCPTGPMFAKLDQREFPFKAFPDKLLPYHNEFERVAPCESLELIETLLKLGAGSAALTGSGSAVFGRFADETEALRAKKVLEQQADISVWTAKSLDRASSLAISPAKDL
jgi:4-diphosphocytidyl-2C-methyl-D-erythritol kinase